MTGVLTTALKQLVRAGMTGDELVAAFGEIERDLFATMQLLSAPVASKDDAAEKRRAYDRERKRAKAAEEKERQNSTGIPAEIAEVPQNIGNSGGSAEVDPTLPLPPNENNSNPPTPTHPNNIPPREAVPFDAHVGAWLEWLAAKPKGKGGKRVSSSDTPDRPDEVSEQVWSDFLKHRRKHKADLTATALAGFRREADRVGWSLERAIEESILRNWRGFKADWVKNDDRNGNSNWGASSGNRGARAEKCGFSTAIDDELERLGFGDTSGSSGRWDAEGPAPDQELRIARGRVL